jgi:hypothetical protein
MLAPKGSEGSIPLLSAMKASAKKKTHQLGMPFGTAMGRLRKLVLFQIVCEAGRNICFKCSKHIEIASELSIEHKVPWLDNDIELFWDLGNIAFSHLKCNKAERFPTTKYPAVGDMTWCSGCRAYVSNEEFGRGLTAANCKNQRFRYYCKKCRKMKKS